MSVWFGNTTRAITAIPWTTLGIYWFFVFPGVPCPTAWSMTPAQHFAVLHTFAATKGLSGGKRKAYSRLIK